jgi:hypothetical protein
MLLELLRTYHTDGTNGLLLRDGLPLCYTIELPWHDNAAGLSCIPEGSYLLAKRFSPRFQWHLQVLAVPDRDLILIHPANRALAELKGCIAPVTNLTGVGTGTASRTALQALQALVFPLLQKGEQVWLVVASSDKPLAT